MVVYSLQNGDTFIIIWLLNILLDILIDYLTFQKPSKRIPGNQIQNKVVQTFGILGFQKIFIFSTIIIIKFSLNKDLIIGIQIGALVCLIYQINIKMTNIRPFIDDKQFRKHFTLFTSFFYLVTVGHIFIESWVKEKLLVSEPVLKQYIYSIYFAFTTIVTVGYGDITPQNEFQIIIVIFLQIFGSAMFAYIINIIGMTIIELKKNHQILEQKLTIANKIAKCLHLKADLAYRLRMFLKNNTKAINTFSLQQQKRILNKLDPYLKNQILNQTNTKVIKKCIFFLTFFSKAFQDKIALKLIKNLFQPNQIVHKQNSMYIIDQGKLDVMIYKTNINKKIYKKARTILQNGQKDDIKSNVYGYTEIISDRKVNLSAISKTFTIAYQLTKKDFLEAIQIHPADFQMYCQLKDRFNSKYIIQSVQAPVINNFRCNYYPIFLIVKRQRLKRSKQKQVRKYIGRKYKKRNTIIKLLDEINIQSNVGEEEQQYVKSNKKLTLIFSNSKQFGFQQQQQQEWQFQCKKNYANYFKQSNSNVILKKYNQLRKQRLQS